MSSTTIFEYSQKQEGVRIVEDPTSYGPFPVDEKLIPKIQYGYAKFQKNLVFPLVQSEYIRGRRGEERLGVCRAVSCNWIERVLKEKKSFGHSSKSSPDFSPIENSLSWHPRMARKFVRFCHEQNTLSRRANLDQLGLIRSSKEIQIYPAKTPTTPLWQPICGAGFSSPASQAFLIDLNTNNPNLFGHSMALHIDRGSGEKAPIFTFMDPNLGEFSFNSEESDWYSQMQEFLSIVITIYKAEIDLSSAYLIKVASIRPAIELEIPE